MTTTHLIPPTDTHQQAALGATIRWIDPLGAEHTEPATGLLLDAELYLATQIRVGNHYPGQKNYHGYFYFSQVQHHLWHESLLEATMMLWLDLHESIVAITAQPMQIRFADDSTHFPDLFALHGNGRQILYDVKPSEFMTDKVVAQFAQTRALCEQIGWGYRVLHELPGQVRINVNWLSAFRNPRYDPGRAAAELLIKAAAAGPLTILAALRALQMPFSAHARASIYYLVATQVLTIDLTRPLSDASTVTLKDNQ